MAIEVVLNKKQKPTIERAYSKTINDYSTNSFESFFEDKISKESTIFTDLLSSYKPFAKDYKIHQEKLNNGQSIKLLHPHIMNLKSWICGIHGHRSIKHAQFYMDGFHFKFNRPLNLENCFDKTLLRMIQKTWFSYNIATDDLNN